LVSLFGWYAQRIQAVRVPFWADMYKKSHFEKEVEFLSGCARSSDKVWASMEALRG
jgi:hypothetical protein